MDCKVTKTEQHHLLFKVCWSDEAACEICTVYGEGEIPQTSAHRWFSSFENRNFDLTDGTHWTTNEFDEERSNAFFMKINAKQQEQINCD